MEKNYFTELYSVDVGDKIEKKNGLNYLSWAWAWAEVKKRHPDAYYTIYENADGWNYHHDGHTCWVKTGVTVNGLEHIEYLPVMNHRNQSIPLDMVSSFDVNKSIQRSLTKSIGRHGLGLFLYAGEDTAQLDDSKYTMAARTPEEAEAQAKKEREDTVKQIYSVAAENGIDKEGTDAWVQKQFNKSMDELTKQELVGVRVLFEKKSKMKAVKKEVKE